MSKVIVLAGQNLYDIAIQHCGNADIALEIARMNNMSITDTLIWGAELFIPIPANTRVVSFLKQGNWQPATALQASEPFGIDFDIIEFNLEIA
jgi:hypothetical protein